MIPIFAFLQFFSEFREMALKDTIAIPEFLKMRTLRYP